MEALKEVTASGCPVCKNTLIVLRVKESIEAPTWHLLCMACRHEWTVVKAAFREPPVDAKP